MPSRVRSSRVGGAPGDAGMLAIAGGVLWIVALAIEYAYDLQPPAPGRLFYVDQLLFAAAMIGWLGAVVGFARLQAAGEGNGRFALVGWGLGIALLALGNLISLGLHAFVSGSDAVYDDNPLFAVGGILSLLGALVAGVVVARAQRLRHWRRWVVLMYAFYYLLALFVPLFLGHEPNFVTEAFWGVAWCGVGLALFTAERDDVHARKQ